MPADPEVTLESLVDAQVLESSAEGAQYRLAESFADAVTTQLSAPTDELEQMLTENLDEDVAAVFVRSDLDDRFLARAVELASREGFVDGEIVQLSLVMDGIAGDRPPTAGVPAGFLPIRGDLIDFVRNAYAAAVIYVWREDCPPCDDVRETLETAEIGSAPDLGSFAVYGPNRARHLEERHSVVGAPTTLFICNGAIDARLQGAKSPRAFRDEIGTVRERATAPTRAHR